MGNVDLLRKYQWSDLHNVGLIDCRSPIYSLAEQMELPSKLPRSADLYWSPHYIVPALIRCRTMVTIHDIFHLAMPQYVKGPHKRAYAKGLFMVIARKAGTVVCSSDYTLSEVKRLTKIDHSKLHRVHLGVDEAWFDAVPERNPHPEPYLLYVGNVKPHKNLRALLSAYRMIEGEIPHDLVIVGKNEGFITGDAQVAEEARLLGGRVKFTGSISLAVLRQYVIHADCLVLPSLYEGFGLPPLEAMACGCPTIVSTAASLPEVCGDASLYIDPHRPEDIAAKIKMLLNDEALRSELRSKGRQQAARFGWEKTADEMIEICEGLLGA
jgi:glycosyltransferase involved in cell wall biosynthesis